MLRNSLDPRLALVRRAAWPSCARRSAPCRSSTRAAELLQRADHRFDALRAQTQFFDQTHAAAAAARETRPSLAPLLLRLRLAQRDAVVVPIALQQHFQRPQVVRQPAENLILFQPVGHRHLHRAVERQFARVDALQHLEGGPDHVVAFQQLGAEAAAGDFDLLGQGDFLLPSEQRNLAHLRQVHAHGVVRPRLVFVHGARSSSSSSSTWSRASGSASRSASSSSSSSTVVPKAISSSSPGRVASSSKSSSSASNKVVLLHGKCERPIDPGTHATHRTDDFRAASHEGLRRRVGGGEQPGNKRKRDGANPIPPCLPAGESDAAHRAASHAARTWSTPTAARRQEVAPAAEVQKTAKFVNNF